MNEQLRRLADAWWRVSFRLRAEEIGRQVVAGEVTPEEAVELMSALLITRPERRDEHGDLLPGIQ